MIKLGVNIDHIATLRNARGINMPDVVTAALVCEQNGADYITVHLREDRRHIKDNDVILLRKSIKTKLNLEIAVTKEMFDFAMQIKPDYVCFVPENRQEKTTEDGLNLVKNYNILTSYIKTLHANNIKVSLFINPKIEDVKLAQSLGSYAIEIHTGEYSSNNKFYIENDEYHKILNATKFATSIGLKVNAGHGLDYNNVLPIAKINQISELNIGFSIIAKSIFSGLPHAVSTMKNIIIGNNKTI